jgi:hypothetical protein
VDLLPAHLWRQSRLEDVLAVNFLQFHVPPTTTQRAASAVVPHTRNSQHFLRISLPRARNKEESIAFVSYPRLQLLRCSRSLLFSLFYDAFSVTRLYSVDDRVTSECLKRDSNPRSQRPSDQGH